MELEELVTSHRGEWRMTGPTKTNPNSSEQGHGGARGRLVDAKDRVQCRWKCFKAIDLSCQMNSSENKFVMDSPVDRLVHANSGVGLGCY